MFKTCTKCHKKIQEKFFPKRGKLYRSTCRKCYNSYYRKYMKGNKKHQSLVRKNKHAYRERLTNIKLSYGCSSCGYNKCGSALHFHHIDPLIKSFEIGCSTHYSEKLLQIEINKCCILCANCHAEVEAGIVHILVPLKYNFECSTDSN